MLDWSARATLALHTCAEGHLSPLRDAGLDDRDLLDLAQIVGYYNYANRTVEMLGVELEEPDTPFRWKDGLRDELRAGF